MKTSRPPHPVEAIRRERFAQLVKEQGSPQAMADLLGVKPSRISQLLNGHTPFTDRVARAIEEKAGQRYSWLDGLNFSLDGVDQDLERLLKLTVQIIQNRQIKENTIYPADALAEIFVLILKRLYLAQRYGEKDTLSDAKIRDIINGMLP